MIKIQPNLLPKRYSTNNIVNHPSGNTAEFGKRKLLMQRSRRIVNQHSDALKGKICSEAHIRRVILARRFLNTSASSKRIHSCLEKILETSLQEFKLFEKQAQMAQTCLIQLMKRHNLPSEAYRARLCQQARQTITMVQALKNEYLIKRKGLLSQYYHPLNRRDFHRVMTALNCLYKELLEQLIRWQYGAIHLFSTNNKALKTSDICIRT